MWQTNAEGEPQQRGPEKEVLLPHRGALDYTRPGSLRRLDQYIYTTWKQHYHEDTAVYAARRARSRSRLCLLCSQVRDVIMLPNPEKVWLLGVADWDFSVDVIETFVNVIVDVQDVSRRLGRQM